MERKRRGEIGIRGGQTMLSGVAIYPPRGVVVGGGRGWRGRMDAGE